MTGKLGDEASPKDQPEAELALLVEREPGSFLRAACLAWHRRARLAFADKPAPATLFAEPRRHESEVSKEAFEEELPAKMLAFYRRCRRSAALERRLLFALRHGGNDTAQVAQQALRDTDHYGLRYVLNKASDAGRELASRARQVMVELHRLKGLVRLVPVRVGDEEILVGRAETPHHIADLLVVHFHERFAQYRIVLLVGDKAYISGEAGEVLTDDAEPYRQALAQDDFERFWLAYYGSQSISRRAKPRLRQQRLPKRYWSWVREAAQFASDGS
jgi:probable DNA metabolism protein